MRMKPVEPVFVTELFCQIHDQLLSLLRNLSGDDWSKPTAARQWVVKDIAAHLLDGDIRRLSYQRDNAPMVPRETPIAPASSATTSNDEYRDLVNFLNQLNADWIKAAKRISPRLLIEFLEVTGAQVCELFSSLDPFAPALFGVAWAGEQESQNWFDLAREYTEKWHHQQQIRDAVGAPPLTSRKWLFPVLDTFLRGLPYTYRGEQAEEGSSVVFIIAGEAGGAWTLNREGGAWKLYAGESDTAVSQVRMEQDVAWRLLTKGLSREEAARRVEIVGDYRLGELFLGMLAVMA
ncbi:MAG TPA: maleylpyruvate isomerase N-terminal domain-containing protein [Blastocatellia bacterium]|nr:maleylpyruvate isomerase N-terminal domain-containing protein [Blastocatellia bacterium]